MRTGPPKGSWRQRGRLQAVRAGRVLATLPIEWDDSTRGPLGGTWLSGRDLTGFLEIAMPIGPDLKGGLSIRAPASDDVLRGEVLPVLRFAQDLKRADRLRVVPPKGKPVEARVTGDIVGPEVPGVALAEALARIQETSGVTFALPRRWTGPDADMVYFCDQLLHTGAVAWPWPGGQVNAAAASAAALVASGPLPRMSVSGTGHADATIALFGHQIPLPGVLQMTATNLVVANAPELAALVRQVPPWASVPLVLVADDLTSCAFHLREPTEDREESDPEPAPDADEVNADR